MIAIATSGATTAPGPAPGRPDRVTPGKASDFADAVEGEAEEPGPDAPVDDTTPETAAETALVVVPAPAEPPRNADVPAAAGLPTGAAAKVPGPAGQRDGNEETAAPTQNGEAGIRPDSAEVVAKKPFTGAPDGAGDPPSPDPAAKKPGQPDMSKPGLAPQSPDPATVVPTGAAQTPLPDASLGPADLLDLMPGPADPDASARLDGPATMHSVSSSARLSAPALMPDIPRIAESIAHASRALADGPVELTLNPEELGRVRLTLHGSDNGMTVQLAVERPETLDLLRRNIDLLAADLRQAGYERLTFAFAGQQGQGGQGAPSGSALPTPPSEPAIEHTVPHPVTTLQLSAAGLDLRL